MSQATKEALADAVRAHLTDELPGAVLTDWAIVAAATRGEESTHYLHERSPSPFHTLLGLLTVGAEHLRDTADDE